MAKHCRADRAGGARGGALAKAVGGAGTDLIRGETVFRVLQGIKWPILMNLGLSHAVNRAVRFTMHIGADIRAGLADPQLRNKRKANVLARGYEEGGRATPGCSYKGRIWSYRIANDISEWVAWCKRIGDKLLDDRISVDALFAGAIVPEAVTERPRLVPTAIEWGERLLERSEDVVQLEIDGRQVPLLEVGIELTTIAQHGPLRFRVFSESDSAEYELRFGTNGVDYVPITRRRAKIWIGRRWKPLEDWFCDDDGPVIYFADGSFLVYAELFRPTLEGGAFNAERINVLDWTGVDLARESQSETKDAASIQYRLIRHLTREGCERVYDVIFDDDGPGEAADVVAMKLEGDRLLIDLFHASTRTLESRPRESMTSMKSAVRHKRTAFGRWTSRSFSVIYGSAKPSGSEEARCRASKSGISRSFGSSSTTLRPKWSTCRFGSSSPASRRPRHPPRSASCSALPSSS